MFSNILFVEKQNNNDPETPEWNRDTINDLLTLLIRRHLDIINIPNISVN